MTAPPPDDSSAALTRAAQEHVAALQFALADLRVRAARGYARGMGHRLDALMQAIAAAEAACLSVKAPPSATESASARPTSGPGSSLVH
ncbi:hypothetical protein [Roseospira navarrensis]|uniref:Uncharacterized protein n=1 Tax=Roseospira navarrensis TaxID=140058 RepID=A0A7X1ZFY7_9PROT|nr:hypothetical protein [Roseospira navarrensis]MQX37811.1 hypothetical protein [Roseospira navarrensis]